MYSAFLKLILGAALLLLQSFMTVNAQTPPPQTTPAPLQTTPVSQAAKLLPSRLGDFKAASVAASLKPELVLAFLRGPANDFGQISAASRRYTYDGQRFLLTIITTANDSSAYALLTNAKRSLEQSGGAEYDYAPRGDVGTASFLFPDKLLFVKGPAFVVVNRDDATPREPQPPVDIARAFAETLDRGEGEIPVLVKHLPDWQKVRGEALYAVSLDTLKSAFSNQPVFDALSFDGGAEAVSARYHVEQLVIVEFNTPQLATDNDRRITAKLEELRNQGQPVPTAYRRVGNYSVFVFDAPNQEAANRLIDQVKYEQMVQWLGENPYLYERALREFTQATLGVFVNVVKGSGLALVSCLAVGGLFGGLLFIRRRAQQRAVGAYSDSGGLLRLNLDEMTPEIEPSRLLGPGK